jgi:hypothetical protein
MKGLQVPLILTVLGSNRKWSEQLDYQQASPLGVKEKTCP